MPKLEGRWAWHNFYGSVPIAKCIDRARNAKLPGVIVKYGNPEFERLWTAAGIPFAVERYVLYRQPEAEGTMLANAVDAGAVAAVINAEEGGDEDTGGHWERDLDGSAMTRLVAEFRARHPTVELYASVDTRGDRLNDPYQRVLARHIAAWLPMIYPKAFGQPVAKAFSTALDDKDFGGIPVYPTIQTYDGIGPEAVMEQLAEVKRRGLAGCQAYTICHATDEEWAAFAKEEAMPTNELAILKMQVNLATLCLAGKLQEVADALAYVGVKAK